MDDFEPFHSAVNRIPVLRKSGERLADAGRLPKSLFKDQEAPGRDRLYADRWSGSISWSCGAGPVRQPGRPCWSWWLRPWSPRNQFWLWIFERTCSYCH